jgi:hypothetical protein
MASAQQLAPRQIANADQARTVGKGGRVIILFIITAVLLLGLLGSRVWYLQFLEGDRNRVLAEDNRIRLIPEAPERGRLLDRNGKILASSRLARGVSLWPIAQPPTNGLPRSPNCPRLSTFPQSNPPKIRGRGVQLSQSGAHYHWAESPFNYDFV